MTRPTPPPPNLARAAAEAKAWLFEDLLPLWSTTGRCAAGGFVERIGLDGVAVAEPKRTRVQARQIYVFAEAGRLGWSGPWRDCVAAGLDFLMARCRRPDGLAAHQVSRDGGILDDRALNYDQAFLLFALAQARAGLDQPGLEAEALAILARLKAERRHLGGGLHESNPPAAPLLSNPHMHMFEAMLAWRELGGAPEFAAFAEEIAALAARSLIDPASGAVREHFALDWSPMPGAEGAITEPGHQFEWAWLIRRHIAGGGRIDAGIADRLYAHAARHGLDPARHVAVNEVAIDGRVLDANARLWPQTERLKAALALAQWDDAVDAWTGLKSYAVPGRPGLYRDKSLPDGGFVDEPAPASTLYHIVCALAEFVRAG
jgi:mannose/cellobiose epimerase-like protein (N-acyl-D-glucosamine 2-epimerase family)